FAKIRNTGSGQGALHPVLLVFHHYDISVTILPGLGGGQGNGGNRPERRLRGQDRSGVSFTIPRLVHLKRTKELRDWHKAINPAALKEMAPAQFKVNFDTSAGVFEVEVHRDWSPNGADRFYNLVKNGFFDNARFFRVISGFMVQFGLNGDPAVNSVWREARIP